ncbi:restriction endonuclease subunit S [Providencia stuartii]|uniref:restriction endonuclease subunit S n=1 Tax=Providencia stuartii TaxID=588 RepID=UPI00300CE941
MSWPLGKITDIAEIISGFAFKSEWFGAGNAKVIRISDLKNGSIDLSGAMVFDEKAHKVREQFRVKSGDILMALSGATVGKISVADLEAEGAYLNQRVAIIRGRCYENTEFLKYIFTGNRLQKLLLNAGGAAQPNLSPKDLAEMEIPIPPLTEQKRIAAILNKADNIRQKREQAIKLADDFLRAIFLHMFCDPENNSKKFPVGTIRDLVSSANYGSSEKASEHNGKYPILRMGNITYQGDWDFTDLKYIDLDEKSKDKFLVRKGDLLFNRTNSKELVGKTAVFESNTEMAFAGYLVRVRTNELGNNYYISGYLNSLHGKNTLVNMSKSIVGMANINAQEMQNIRILIPPKELQDRYEYIYKAVKDRVITHIESKNELEKLFNTLSYQFYN